MSVVTPTHRWRDTILATTLAIGFVLFAMSGLLVHSLAALWAAALALGIVSRLWGAYRKDVEFGLLREPRHPRLKWHRRQLALRIVFLVACLCAVGPLVGVLHFFGDVTSIWIGVSIVSGLWIVVSATPRKTIPIATNVGFALASLSVIAAWATILFATPAPVAIDAPLQGEYAAIQGGPSPMLNHHWLVAHQRYALDLVVLKDGLALQPDTDDVVAGAHGFGASLRSPGHGTVVTVVDGREDDGKSLRDPEGNHIVVDIGDGQFVLYAHVKKGSFTVAEGDVVKPGQVIGQLGHSGNSGMPHLHIQVQDKPTFDKSATTFPIALRDARIVGGANTAPVVRRGDRLSTM